MKRNGYFVLIVLLGIFLLFPQLSACVQKSFVSSTPSLYWDVNSGGSIETNDITRLQKELPFTIILPEYLPDELKSIQPRLVLDKETVVGELDIHYSSSESVMELNITEYLPSKPLPPGMLGALNPDYTPITLAGIQVFEAQGNGQVFRGGKAISEGFIQYMWDKNNLHFNSEVYGYDQTESRKIIESMVKQ